MAGSDLGRRMKCYLSGRAREEEFKGGDSFRNRGKKGVYKNDRDIQKILDVGQRKKQKASAKLRKKIEDLGRRAATDWRQWSIRLDLKRGEPTEGRWSRHCPPYLSRKSVAGCGKKEMIRRSRP